MSSTAVLRTPSASRRAEYLSLRPSTTTTPRENDRRREQSLSPSILVSKRIQTPLGCSYNGASQATPSPLRRRILFQDDNDCSDSDDEGTSPSLRSPLTSQCASSFLGSWAIANRKSKVVVSPQPIEDDEGLFLSTKTVVTPPPVSHKDVTPGALRRSNVNTTGSSSTPAPQKRPSFATLSPLPPSRSRIPETPAETEWHLGRQAESMTKLSLGDPEESGHNRIKKRLASSFNCSIESSPTPSIQRRGRKRSFAGNELPRSTGKIFESLTDTPVNPSFHFSDRPSSPKPKSPALFFGPSIHPSPVVSGKAQLLAVPAETSTESVHSRSLSPKSSSERIAKKYKPRDSGVAGMEEDVFDVVMPTDGKHGTTDEMAAFITPGIEPSSCSAWPIVPPTDKPEEVDNFILKTLAAGGAPPKEKKVMPGTPVKRNAYMSSRPWTSSKAVPSALPRGVPRKSLPLMFPNLLQTQNSPGGQDDSPTNRTFRKPYGEIGQGRPGTLPNRGQGAKAKFQGLMRRSSSGAFSTSSSEGSLLGTPTKLIVSDALRVPSPQSRVFRLSSRSSFGVLPHVPNEYERPGQFERNFIVVDDLGSGQFGSALKVRYKQGNNAHEIFAIKKSKRMEGIKHRRRLREEVDVLQHLKEAGGSNGHPNVLAYIDSWEEEDILYIQTELCELGNYATFLAEYGSHFEALDEARVWKVCTELSHGLKFIHDSGVIHLDLKPANIFITSQGRFRIGDFGMASLWPRKTTDAGFEREGDREYMAVEVLQGCYGPAADVFSLGMIILETATNIVVPDMGEDWHRLRQDDFSAIDFVVNSSEPRSSELIELIVGMMRSDPKCRLTIEQVHRNPVIRRAREAMEYRLAEAIANRTTIFAASPLGGEPISYLSAVLLIRHPTAADPSS